MKEETPQEERAGEEIKKPRFEDVAKKIIQKAFRAAICIDDEFESAYSEDEGLNRKDSSSLYKSFREKGRCNLDIHTFKNFEDSWREYMIQNKDLVILDWELDLIGNKFESTLKILKSVIETNKIPFIVIYTNTQDLSIVSETIMSKLSPISQSSYDAFVNTFNKLQFISEGEVDFESFKEVNPKLFHEYIFNYSKREEISKEIYTLLDSELNLKAKHKNLLTEKIEKTVCNSLKVNIEDTLIFLCYLVLRGHDAFIIDSVTRIETSIPSYIFNNFSNLLLFQKHTTSGGIEPNDLFEAFSNALVNNPHNFVSLLALEFKESLKENFSAIGAKFSAIDEKAFLYHMGNYKSTTGTFKKGTIYDFILRSWINELYQQKIGEKSEVLNYLDERYIEQHIKGLDTRDDLLLELFRYSAYISTTDLSYKQEKNVWFGDIFKNDKEEYFLCITPHCDCLRPEKIKNNFYFVKGTLVTDKRAALINAEKDFFSFVIDGKPVCIEWKSKPFTSYVVNPTINSFAISYSGVTSTLSYLTSLKENYSQRISNEAFSYGYRVGIDLPHIHGDEDA